MASEQARELRRQGIAAAKAGQNEQARQLLQQAIRLDPRNEAAWVWLASIARDKRERLFCFQKLLEVNPQNETALKALHAMGIAPEELGKAEAAPAAGQAPAASAAPSSAPGVPLPDAEKIAQAKQQVDAILQEYRRRPDKLESVTWVQKNKKRAGERDSLYLRAYVAVGIVAALAVLGVLGVILVNTSPEIQRLVFASTEIPSLTPSFTPTPTPGFTPTPSPTPELTPTPSPTINPAIQPGSIDNPPAPTDVYPAVRSRVLMDSIHLMNQGQAAVALPTLVKERESTELSFNPDPYYYEALALVDMGDYQTALLRLQEAEGRLDEPSAQGQNYKPYLDLGFAQLFLSMAEDAQRERRSGQAADYLVEAEERALAAIERDPRLAQAYLVLSRRYSAVNRYEDALRVLNENPAIADNTNIVVERGEVYFAQGDLPRAAQEAYLALYINPTIEQAYVLQIKTALAQGDAGGAVIYAQNYLFFYPGSAQGWTLLGQARQAEGNTDLALGAYNQALAAEELTPATVDTLLARAEIYRAQGRDALARDDLTQALDLSNDPEVRALRMQSAYNAGNYRTALSDIEILRGLNIVPEAELHLLQARILIDDASPTDAETHTTALGLLDQASANLSAEQRGVLSEYRARAHYRLEAYADALRAVEAALAVGETGSRYFLRGQILEALDRDNEALRAYEWVVTWGEIYPYAFLPQARARLEDLGGAS